MKRSSLLALSLFTAFLISLSFPPVLQAQSIVYGGYLTDMTGIPIKGNHSLKLSLLNQTKGGVNIWTETHENVPFDAGKFSVALGLNSPGVRSHFESSDQIYLTILVDNSLPEHKLLLPYPKRKDAAKTGSYGNPSPRIMPNPVPGNITKPTRTTTASDGGGSNWICPFLPPLSGLEDEYLEIGVVNTGSKASEVVLSFKASAGQELKSMKKLLQAGQQWAWKIKVGKGLDLERNAAYATINGKDGLFVSGYALSRKRLIKADSAKDQWVAIPIEWIKR